jgi:cytochrome bd-type quinol oxidase subunit 2
VAGDEKRKRAAAADASGIENAANDAAGVYCGDQPLDAAGAAIAARWFTLPNLFYLLPVPALVVIFSLYQWRCLNNPDSHSRPFILTLGLIFLGFSGLGISIWPHIIPPSITLWQAAAPRKARALCWWARC